MRETDQAGIDAALRHMPYGLHVVTARGPGGDHGLTASWVMQVSKVPPMVAVALRKGSASAKVVEAGGAFAVNILAADSSEIAERFFTPVDRFGSPPQPVVSRGVANLPLLGEAIGWVECEVRHRWDPGDHVLFVGEVVAGDLKKSAMPLTTLAAGMSYGGTST